ncbi:hypothetical protein JY651_08745 [Pyxidicoccus parkwayensis]|uniref:Protein rhiA n=1 Tax=Pyxidicoccus parkwayensis TaxID=2813578 RepID=A0ABX7P3I9_9BACT|nr:hypothetical protein [Pyxidicoccus parkwaysis]QSQ25002.1 hypothetical protein JY651_08745 [Pyxidicoccus parkwaysis]
MTPVMDVATETVQPRDESAYVAKVDAPKFEAGNPYGFAMDALKPDDGTKYSITMINQSAQPWIFYVYQTLPDQPSDIFSLAWLASPYEIVPNAQITFTWTIQYTFLWSQTGVLKPGVSFVAGMTENADPDSENLTDFSVTPGPNLTPAQPGADPGTLEIIDGADVPPSEFSVGIGMGDAGTFAVQAGPNLKHIFTPTPTYYVAAGVDQQVGTVLDIQTVTQAAEANFPKNVYSITAILQSDNTWAFK